MRLSPPPDSLFEASQHALTQTSHILANIRPSSPENVELEISPERLDHALDRRMVEGWERGGPKRPERSRRRSRTRSTVEYADDDVPAPAPPSNPTSSNPTAVPSGTTASREAPPAQHSSGTVQNDLTATIPWDDHTVQNQKMRQLGLVVYRPLHILICIKCKSVINPDHIYSHVRRDLPHAEITPQYCERLSTKFGLTPRSRLERPSGPRSAIPCLQLREGYAYCEGCGYAAKCVRTLTSKHATCPGFGVKTGFAQSFFPHSNQGGYFAVTVPPPQRDSRPVDLVQRLKDAFPDPNPADVPIALPENPRDSNHFLHVQRWVPTLNRLTGAEIQFVTSEANPTLRGLVSNAIDRYMSTVDKSLTDDSSHSIRVAMGSYNGLVFPLGFPCSRLLTK